MFGFADFVDKVFIQQYGIIFQQQKIDMQYLGQRRGGKGKMRKHQIRGEIRFCRNRNTFAKGRLKNVFQTALYPFVKVIIC